jgi:hypothetical protein
VARTQCGILREITFVGTAEDYDVDVRNIRNGVVDITNNVVVKCCK